MNICGERTKNKEKVMKNWMEFVEYNKGKVLRMKLIDEITDKQKMKTKRAMHLVFIKEGILLPNNDILVAVQEAFPGDYIDECFFEICPIQYFKLSEIRLSYFEDDMDEFY